MPVFIAVVQFSVTLVMVLVIVGCLSWHCDSLRHLCILTLFDRHSQAGVHSGSMSL